MYRLHLGCQGQAVGEESSMQGPGSRVALSVPPFKEAHFSPHWGLKGQRVRP